MKCVCNDIVKLFKVKIICYVKRVREMHELAKYRPPPYMKRESVMSDNWNICNKKFTTSDIRLAIKDRLPKSMRGELDDHPENYCSLTYEDWCDLLSTIEVKYERKISAVQINRIASVRESSIYDSNESVRIPRKNKSKTGVLRYNTSSKRVRSRHHGIQRYFVLCKNSGMPDCNYMSYSTKDFTCVCTNRSIKDGLVRPMRIRTDSVKHYKRSEKNGGRSLNLSRSRTRCYIALTINQVRAVISIRSRRSGQELLRRVATLPVMIRTPIHH